jgi:hypothetical protein
MATRTLRRTVATAALAGLATALAPVAVSLVAPSAAVAATAAPAIDKTKSAPAPNGSLTTTGDNVTAVFDQQITGQDGKSSDTCKDTSGASQCAFVLYEVNADGSRGLRLPGATSFESSGNPVTGVQDTVAFNPDFSLVNGDAYEAVVHVFGVDSSGKKVAGAVSDADYKVFINTTAPYALSAPAFANTQNNTAFPLSGYAPSGFTVSVDVENPNDPTGQTDATGSTFVEPCASAPLCPWTVPVDISSNQGYPSSATNVDWTATEQDANGNPSSGFSSTASAQSPKATFTIDYSAPDIPSSSPAPSLAQDASQHTASVSVNGQEADNANNADVASYLITVSDPSANKVTQTFPSQGNDLPAHTVDVTTLDDGQLTVLIQAVDSHGNVSSASCASFPPGSPCSKYSGSNLVKNVGLAPNLGTSLLTSSGGDTTFSEAQQGQAVQSPTTVTVGFTQTIKESFQDCCTSSGPVTNHSSMCIATPNGNCIQSATPTVASDKKSISMKLASKLQDGSYAVKVHTYSQSNCPDRTPATYAANGGKAPNCENYNDSVRIPGTGVPGTAFTFTVDTSKPTISIDSYTHPVTATNEKSAAFSGTVSKSVSSVQLLIKSSGSGTARLLFNAAVTQPTSSADPNATWAVGPADLSALPDGTLTIKATAKESNGLTGIKTVHATMRAHRAVLSERIDKHKVTDGHAVKISGHLSDEAGAAISGENVTVKPKFGSGHSGRPVTAITDAGGAYSVTIHPQHNATFYATYAGSPQHDAVTVHTASALVRFAVKIASPKQGAHVSSPVLVKGSVGPHHKGATVTFYRHTAGGNVVIGHAKLNKKSHFGAKLVLTPGTNKVFATVKKTSGNAAGKSSTRTLHVS